MTSPAPDDEARLFEAFLRDHDWRSSPLGAPAGWDPLLRHWWAFLLRSAQPMFLLWGEARAFLFNDAYRPLLGPRFAEAIGRPYGKLYEPVWAQISPFVDQVFAGRSAVLRDRRMATWQSDFRDEQYFDFAFSPILDVGTGGEGPVVGAHVSVADRTDRVRLDQRLARERRLFHGLFDQAHGFFAAGEGPDHRFTYANAAFRDLIGRDVELGRPVAELMPELADQGIIELLDRVYETGEPFIARNFAVRIRQADGAERERVVDVVYQAMRDEEGRITGICCEGHDVTEQALARERVISLQGELIHASRLGAMGMMAATLAHELNQPLTAVSAYVSAARRHAANQRDSAGPLLDTLEGADAAASRAADIIRRLRAMTGRDGGLARMEMDVGEAIREAASLAQVGHPGVTIRLVTDHDPRVEADPVQIQQVIINLIQNACDAISGPTTEILIEVTTLDDHVEVCVRDRGPGIEPEILPIIFESFATTKPQGMGLGLSISRTIVEKHGGRIRAANPPGGGAEICFLLPRAGRRASSTRQSGLRSRPHGDVNL